MGWLKNVFDSKQKVEPTSVHDGNFQREVKQFAGAVLVDVWGPGCGPCDQLAPVMVELATQYKGKVKVCELNAAEAQKTAGRLGVRGTPTTIAFKNGAEIGRIVGFKPKSFWVQMIETEYADVLDGDATFDTSSGDAGSQQQADTAARKVTGKAAKRAAKRERLRNLRSNN